MCPSDAAIAISLGPTNPLSIVVAAETLVFRRTGISPVLRLLVPTFLLVHAPRWLTPSASSQSTILSYRLCISWKIQTSCLEYWNKDRDVRIEPITSSRVLLLLFVTPRCFKNQWKKLLNYLQSKHSRTGTDSNCRRCPCGTLSSLSTTCPKRTFYLNYFC